MNSGFISSGNYEFQITEVTSLLNQARDHYYNLVLITGADWRTRTTFLKELAFSTKYSYVSLGLPLSRALIDQPVKDRPFLLSEQISNIITTSSDDGVILDHIEILFAPALRTNPLGVLQANAHSRMVVASWPGSLRDGNLTYASPGHPEHYSQQANGLLIYSIEVYG
jgi:hypothetical protein